LRALNFQRAERALAETDLSERKIYREEISFLFATYRVLFYDAKSKLHFNVLSRRIEN
jgi:hypothetical protein